MACVFASWFGFISRMCWSILNASLFFLISGLLYSLIITKTSQTIFCLLVVLTWYHTVYNLLDWGPFIEVAQHIDVISSYLGTYVYSLERCSRLISFMVCCIVIHAYARLRLDILSLRCYWWSIVVISLWVMIITLGTYMAELFGEWLDIMIYLIAIILSYELLWLSEIGTLINFH